MIFKHNKNISRNLIVICCSVFFLSSCGGGGDSSVAEPNQLLSFSVNGLPATVESYDEVAIQIVPSIEGCIFQINSDFLWVVSSEGLSDGLSFTFRAPIIYGESEEFSFQIAPTNTTVQRECDASKNFILNVTRNQTKYIPDPGPSNIPYLASEYFSVNDIGMGGIEITDRYSATVCYPTENDCVTYNNELFGQDAHNMATGDFNGDGFEDFAVAWAIFPHTIDQSKKIYAPVNIYLNDQQGSFAEDLNLYEAAAAPEHPFAYRLVVEDFNGDGLDDIFAGSMGLSVEQGDRWGIDPYPHFLLLSNSLGRFEESSVNINDENNGMGQLCRFAHDASGGDPDGDGDIDLFACNMLLVNDGEGRFTIHPYLNLDWNYKYGSPMSSLLAD